MNFSVLAGAAVLLSILSTASLDAATGPEPGVGVNVFVQLAKKVVPSVVNISTFATLRAPSPRGNPDDFFRFFDGFFDGPGAMPFGPPGSGPRFMDPHPMRPPRAPRRPGGRGGAPDGAQQDPKQRAMSLGTGFLIDREGLILTNHHVIANADEIKINFTEHADEKALDAEVVGQDAELDVALLRVKMSRDVQPLSLGDSQVLEVGEYVMAVGNPFSQGHTVTHGIISAKGRIAPEQPFTRFLQTDAPINPGNSGGPLLNLAGEVIGINNAIDPRGHGIGFAIPINDVKAILPQLKTKGRVSRGYIGIVGADVTPDIAKKLAAGKISKGVFVTHVEPGQPADRAGVQTYDVILEVNGNEIKTFSDLVGAVTSVPVGGEAKIRLLRNGKEKVIAVKVSERPNGRDQLSPPAQPKEKNNQSKRPRLDAGMNLEPLTPDLAQELGLKGDTLVGVIVEQISYDGPADRAGIQRGDLLLEIDRAPIKQIDDFYSRLEKGKSHLVRIRRLDSNGREIFKVVILQMP